MNQLEAAAVHLLPINKKEAAHRSQRRYGFHVYVSRAIEELNGLSMDQQKERYMDTVGPFEMVAADDNSLDSNDTEWRELFGTTCLKYKCRFKIVCSEWRSMLTEKKVAWKSRAQDLNSRLLPGRVLAVPGNVFVFKMRLYANITNTITSFVIIDRL